MMLVSSVALRAQTTLYWRTDGTAGGNWNSTYWNSGSANATGGTGWTAGANAVFSASSTLTFNSATVGNVTVTNGSTVTITSTQTLTLGGVRTFDIGAGSTLTWTSQGQSTAAGNEGAGVIKTGDGTLDWGAGPGTNSRFNGGFTVNSGTVIVSGANSFGTGTLTINGGTIQSSNTTAVTVANAVVFGGNVALSNFSGNGSVTWSGSVNLGGGVRTITNNATSGRSFSGTISNGGLVFNGTGTTTLSGNNTYSGGTTISAGTLTAGHNNALGSGSVIVNTSGTLSIADNVTIGNAIQLDGGSLQGVGTESKFSGTLSGSGTLTGPLTLTDSAIFQWHLNSASTSGANKLSIAAGTLTITAGAMLELSFSAVVAPTTGGFWDVTQTWTIVGKGESGSIAGSSLAVAEGNKSLWNDLGNFQVALQSGSLVLIWTPHVTAIPEPSTYAAWLGAAALVGAGWYRHRQRLSKA